MLQVRSVVLLLLAGLVPALAAAQTPRPEGQPPRGYHERDAATGAEFAAAVDGNGNAILAIKGGDFTLEKVLAHTGDVTLRLSQGKDVVSIAISQNGFDVSRGSRTLRFDPRADGADRLDKVRTLLLGSRAVRSFKQLVASIENRDEAEQDTPFAINALLDGAAVLLLDGDADATKRLARRLTRTQRAANRIVTARLPGQYYDCVGGYQIAVLNAYNQFESCYLESTAYRWWSRDLVAALCDMEWLLRTQQYIWQFISCFMLPF